MNENLNRELLIMLESEGWSQFRRWVQSDFSKSLDSSINMVSLTDLGSILEREQIIGTKKYLNEALNDFELYAENINKK